MHKSSRPGVLARLAPHPPAPPEQSTSKAGRNLKAAIPTALALLALVAASVLVRIEIFVALVAVALCIGLWEAAGAFLNRGLRIPLIPMWVGTLAMVVATWLSGLAGGFLTFLLAAATVFVWRVLDGARGTPADAMASIFTLGWISLLGCFAVALADLPQPGWMVALLILMPVANDTGGWAAGVLWGKHPMSPSISPKKSWEGFVGSLALALVIAVLLVTLGLHRPWYLAVLLAALAVVCSTVGDLSESLLKRDLGVKDMGSIFPGHGGMLDRIDSILMWAPFCYIVMSSGLALG
ncbi:MULTISPECIES: phosphatidate cytidylyltransferase [unclassified Actinobaculum]|uniref:phosphatidate cytidylyltransferase n=1 Tax=unclassified Actinobaculum TaxID=2609299 RepID=UPI000D527C9D|nr:MULTISPECIES: phosphatidate cytidylyltransferase [unclassified Actinobaculum]AWE42660.1 phosphatidate cytidylyltransferase [Actinobaculum sp. 313]RTE49467.1 phosphatidate cytidylyltransferase [Actinobaculum sp. 352]